ncbi:hypothetical protein [Rhizobium leguminosarum]|uniref:hypothetical protein n=1 Tax=Rhizobium leguminosarum TaxID=384 RepID=UPI0014411D63|nr:hypothetical protein [Rhizobium leguminosarum]NKK64646.1 hypothetical protein [Rhizobium leguminosarum bv. viciae]NKL91851.1 hypothetical protein [Rhizobium leguminosarum bv. viciae]
MENPLYRGGGQNSSERFLFSVAERSFLNIWTYPNVYRDQRINGSNRGDGKEVCDLLVVCGDDVIAFSDKDIGWSDTATDEVAWKRWLQEAVVNSAKQLQGGMRWLHDKDLCSRLYLDRECTVPFPIELPPPERMRLHGVIIAAGANPASKRSRPRFGGRLMIDSKHMGGKKRADFPPFTIGDVNQSKPFVHVFDRGGIAMLLSHLDTITDFTHYLHLRAEAIRKKQIGTAFGEDDILGVYLQTTLDDGTHTIPFAEGAEAGILPGRLDIVLNDVGFHRKQQADRESYVWDDLISTFGSYLIDGTAIHEGDAVTFHERQTVFRIMAQETRLSRRVYAKGMLDASDRMKTQTAPRYARFFLPSEESDRSDNCYVFLLMAVPEFWDPLTDYDKYRRYRKLTLQAYCYGLLKHHPELRTCVGIAVDAPPPFPVGGNSQDIAYLDRGIITTELSDSLDVFCSDHNILTNYSSLGPRTMISADEYPQE